MGISICFIVGQHLVREIFPEEIATFVDESCEHWDEINSIPHLPLGCDQGSNIANRLRQMIPQSRGVCMNLNYVADL